MRKTLFQTEYYYHILNRGTDKREVFCDEKDYTRFLRSMREFNRLETIESLYRQDQLKRKEAKPLRFFELQGSSKNRSGLASLVEVICYCLNPNHYHLLLKQIADKGIEKFMHKISTGYTKYFNTKYHRSGSLFQGTYKAVPITADEQLLYVSAYINGNPEIHKIAKADQWAWSSYPDYLGRRPGTLCRKQAIISQFADAVEYKNYANEVIKNCGEIKAELKIAQIE